MNLKELFFLQKFSKHKIRNFWKIWIFTVIIAISISLLLTLPKFGQIPSGLNRDEAAIAYNAFSLLKTGKDEWGKPWPISITSFGDQKLPGYIYTLIPFIKIFGLETWVIRFPSLLAGLIVIISMGLISLKLTKFQKYSPKIQLLTSFIIMILIAISPWHMHFSKVAYETHLAMAFFTSGLACFLFALDSKNKLFQKILIAKTGFLFSLTLLTYHSYQIFIPLFSLTLLKIYYKNLKRLKKLNLLISLLPILFSIILLFKGGVIEANKIKSQGINPFSNQQLLNKATQYRLVSNFPFILNKIIFNKITEGAITFAQNYISTFSGTFFFIHGSNHGDHNPGNNNNLHLFLAPFLLIGLIQIGKNFKQKENQLIIYWVLIALIPSSITINPLLEVRIATIFPILELISLIGIFTFLSFFTKRKKILLSLILVFVVFLSVIRYFIFYTKIAPLLSPDNYNYHLLAQTLSKYKSSKAQILTQSPSSSPYIWYLFENKIDPKLAQKSLVHYEPTDEGFIHVKKIENINFETIDWQNLAKRSQEEPFILILKPEEMPDDKKNLPQFNFIETIKNKHNFPIYEIWEYTSNNLQ